MGWHDLVAFVSSSDIDQSATAVSACVHPLIWRTVRTSHDPEPALPTDASRTATAAPVGSDPSATPRRRSLRPRSDGILSVLVVPAPPTGLRRPLWSDRRVTHLREALTPPVKKCHPRAAGGGSVAPARAASRGPPRVPRCQQSSAKRAQRGCFSPSARRPACAVAALHAPGRADPGGGRRAGGQARKAAHAAWRAPHGRSRQASVPSSGEARPPCSCLRTPPRRRRARL